MSFQALQDTDGHWYRVPSDLAQRFTALLAGVNDHPRGMPGWYAAHDALDSEFGVYLAGSREEACRPASPGSVEQELQRLRNRVAEQDRELAALQLLVYFYQPTEPFAPDGVTWRQRAEQLEAQLEQGVV